MASVVLALGVTTYFTVKKIQDRKDKKRALRNEAFLSKDITEKMAINGNAITDYENDHNLQGHAEDPLPPQYIRTEKTESHVQRKKHRSIKSALGFESL